MELKIYQQKVIDKLNEYIQSLKIFNNNPRRAFIDIKSSEDESVGYNERDFGEVPYICMKLPTGAGKTFVACHSIIELLSKFLTNKLDKGIVLWITPTDAIFEQTLNKLKDSKDFHRKVLNEQFNNNILIFSNQEALTIKKSEMENNLCIIVASLQAFQKQKNKQDKYKVYQQNGSLLPHFENLTDTKGLEKDDLGNVIESLANVIRLSNPLIIIDEGHKTRSDLSIEFLRELNPSFIVEYTATPRIGSNLLVNVSSKELKKEKMVKIPIVLESHKEWEKVIDAGLAQRKLLEGATKNEEEYIRPIALFQAEPDRKGTECITVDKIKEYLLKKGIKKEEIAIKVSDNNELEGINLFSRKCNIKYIITINALAEGWDCSFAYVLVSVANLGSRIAVEQIIGRIIRMPYAKERKDINLNKSYVFASANNFEEAAMEIISGLEDNGYSAGDVISNKEKEEKDKDFVEKQDWIKSDFEIPIFNYEKEPLDFGEHLLDELFDLTKEDYKIDWTLPVNEDDRKEIDINEKDKWSIGKSEKQLSLNIGYKEKRADMDELADWLDRKIRTKQISREEKIDFIKKAITYQIDNNKISRFLISIYRSDFKDKLAEKIKSIMEDYAKKNFDKLVKEGKISLKLKKIFPSEIEMITDNYISKQYNKSYYKNLDKLNKEESSFVDKLDLEKKDNNLIYWIRCREKQEDSFALQGWEDRKFYPDFIAVTKKGNIIVFEWKGEHLEKTPDTAYKESLGKIWEKLGEGKLHFFLVTNKNANEILENVSKL